MRTDEQCGSNKEQCDHLGASSGWNGKDLPKPNKDNGGPLVPIVPRGQCSGRGCPLTQVSVTPYPNTLTYHPLDRTIVYDVHTYDYSYFPPKPMGHQMMFYSPDDIHFSLKNFLTPSDPLTAADAIQTVGNSLRALGGKSLGGLSKLIGPVFPELGTALSAMAGIDSLNSAITIDGHLETKIYSSYQSPFNTPFDPTKIP
jgi:hypothetical protein